MRMIIEARIDDGVGSGEAIRLAEFERLDGDLKQLGLNLAEGRSLVREAQRALICKHPAISSGFLFFGVRAYVSTIRKRTRAHYFPRHSDRAHAAHLQHLV